MWGYKCWVYVLRVTSIDSFYIGFTSDLETRLDAHRKGRGHKATRIGPLELLEAVECTNNTARDIEKRKTLEYIEKYGTDRVVGHRFSCQKGLKQEQKQEHPAFQEMQSLIQYAEEDGEYFRVCRECIYFDNPDHNCTLLDETTLGPNTCVFWSSGLWGETLKEIADNAIKEAESWFTPECAGIVRKLFGSGCRLEQVRDRAFLDLDQQKPYTAFMTQKDLVNDFILRSIGIPKCEDEWDEYDRIRNKVTDRVGGNRCPER